MRASTSAALARNASRLCAELKMHAVAASADTSCVNPKWPSRSRASSTGYDSWFS
jgi:hypothetical protein